MTQWATDEQLRDFNDIYEYTKNLEKRKEDIIRLIDEKWLMTPELKKEIESATTLARVEDLYRPFKEKKNTKATIAKAKWLEPLAKILKKAELTKKEFEKESENFIKINKDKKLSVANKEEAIQWAKDILAEEVSDNANLREKIKKQIEITCLFQSKTTKKFEPNWTYKVYADYSKKFIEIPSYAYLALCRAEKEKQLTVKFALDIKTYGEIANIDFIPKKANTSKIYFEEAIADWLKRLTLPSIERAIRANKKRRSDEAAIKVFGENMKNLLLAPPVKGKVILWFDPAYRTWCKLAVMDQTGKFLANDVIYPTLDDKKSPRDEKILLDLIQKHKINLIVIWNGTASRESDKFIWNFLKKHKLNDIQYMITSEAWASVYSASKLAQEEYPELDVTVRWAISIGHRIQDPLAEFTKIDPKAIGVWQYQHDVDQKLLQHKLDEKVEDTVNAVGVDANTASYSLLRHIAWLSTTIAKNIVKYRDENWEFTKKSQIKKAKWLWPKAYEQCIWFLRIKWWKEILDETWIHPEHHKTVYTILDKEFKITKKDLILPCSLDINNLEQLAEKYEIGFESLEDIFKELARPWLDPRDSIPAPSFKSDILEIEDLEIWMKLDGTVRNVTDFWAFVDIGLHSDGLVHKSQLANFFVSNPIEVVSVGQQVKVTVVKIDLENEKVSLSMKDENTKTVQNTRRISPSGKPKPSIKIEPAVIKWNISWS